jgi:hypothetical protein
LIRFCADRDYYGMNIKSLKDNIHAQILNCTNNRKLVSDQPLRARRIAISLAWFCTCECAVTNASCMRVVTCPAACLVAVRPDMLVHDFAWMLNLAAKRARSAARRSAVHISANAFLQHLPLWLRWQCMSKLMVPSAHRHDHLPCEFVNHDAIFARRLK